MRTVFLLGALSLLLLAFDGTALSASPSPENLKLTLYPGSKAKALIEERKWAEALEELQTLRARSREPGERSLLDFLMGYASFEAGLYEEALLSLSRAEAGPSFLREHALYFRASSYLHLKRWEEAQEVFERLLARHPRGIRAKDSLVGLAEALDGRGRFNEAASLYRRFLRQYPEAEEASYVQYRLAKSLESAGEKRKAAIWLRKLWLESPLASEAPQARKEEEALSRALIPPLPKPKAKELFRRAMALKKAYRCREAIEDFRASLRDGPDRPMRVLIELERSLCHFFLKENNKARKLLMTFTRKNPRHRRVPEALYYLARIYLRQRSEREFLRTIRSLTGRKGAGPWAARAAFLLGRHREDRGELSRALKNYRQLLRIGWIHYRRGNYLSAWSTFRQMEKRFQGEDLLEDALYWEGRSAERLGKPAAAASAYRRLLSAHPYGYYGQLAKRALARLGLREAPSSPVRGLPKAPNPKRVGLA
ncbi:MAG: tol-pal system YbgF family protein, partial [Nitrospinota bacterium]